jgi:hypothetical protein
MPAFTLELEFLLNRRLLHYEVSNYDVLLAMTPVFHLREQNVHFKMVSFTAVDVNHRIVSHR